MEKVSFHIIGEKEKAVARVDGDGILIASAQDMLDLIATVSFQHRCRRLILSKENFDASFFGLRSGLAGEVLQKVVNYGAILAIVGDFSGYTSKALRDFIYESNKGGHVYFLPDVETALEKMQA